MLPRYPLLTTADEYANHTRYTEPAIMTMDVCARSLRWHKLERAFLKSNQQPLPHKVTIACTQCDDHVP